MSRRIQQQPLPKDPLPAGAEPTAPVPAFNRKPSPEESRRDRVAINVFQAMVSAMSPWTDPAELYGRTGTHGALLAKYAFDWADFFLAEREKRQPNTEAEDCI